MVLLFVCLAVAAPAQQAEAEKLIEAGHWKRARTLVEARIREAPADPLANFLLSQVRNAFGDHNSPLPLAEKAVALDGRVAKFHRQVAECLGVMAQHANMFQQVFLARRFRKEIETALSLDPRDTQALRDLMEFYLLAPGILGGDTHKASEMAARLYAVDPVGGLRAQARLASVRQKPDEAEALLRRAAEIQPPSYQARIELAQFYLSSAPANLDSAAAAAAGAISIDRTRVEAYAILAEVHAACAEWKELDAVLDGASREVPDDLTPFYRAAERLLVVGKEPARAQRYLRLYLTQSPEGNAPSLAEARARLDGRTRAGAAAYLLEAADAK